MNKTLWFRQYLCYSKDPHIKNDDDDNNNNNDDDDNNDNDDDHDNNNDDNSNSNNNSNTNYNNEKKNIRKLGLHWTQNNLIVRILHNKYIGLRGEEMSWRHNNSLGKLKTLHN